jgi:hypothetical protein
LRARGPRKPEREDDEGRDRTAPHAEINVSHLARLFTLYFQIC